MFQVIFFFKIPFRHFWPKVPKNRRLFAFFSISVHQNFLIFCFKPSIWFKNKWRFRYFEENSKIAIFGKNYPNFEHFLPDSQTFQYFFRQKFWFFFNFKQFFPFQIEKNHFWRKNPVFALMTHLMSPLSPHQNF